MIKVPVKGLDSKFFTLANLTLCNTFLSLIIIILVRMLASTAKL